MKLVYLARIGIGGALAIACSSSDAGTGGNGNAPSANAGANGSGNAAVTPVATDPLEVQIAKGFCGALQRCSPAILATTYVDAADCVAQETKALSPMTHAADTSITAQIQQCVAAYGSSSCEEQGSASPCVFTGTRADGNACVFGAQCQSGSCWSATQADCGVCAKRVDVGGDCSAAYCVAGAYCSKDKKCVQYLQDGEACSFTAGSPSCNNRTSYCAADRTCTKLAALGAACDDTTICDGASCVDGKCVAGPVASVGQACGADTDGSYTDCKLSACVGLDANGANGTCAALVAPGGACDDTHPCAVVTSCVGGTCVYPDEQRPATCK